MSERVELAPEWPPCAWPVEGGACGKETLVRVGEEKLPICAAHFDVWLGEQQARVRRAYALLRGAEGQEMKVRAGYATDPALVALYDQEEDGE